MENAAILEKEEVNVLQYSFFVAWHRQNNKINKQNQ